MKRISVLILVVLSVTTVAAPARGQTPSPDPIQAGYKLLFDGQKTAAARHFEDLLKAKPDDLSARYGWFSVQNQRIDADATLQPAFEKALDNFIELALARYGRSKQDSEALLSLAQGLFLRAAYKFEHDKGMFGAARDGSKSKGYIDTYLKQHPEHDDAYYVLGLYNYYVDIAPSFVKVLRVFLFLPAGNRVEGLKQIERAAAKGVLNGPFAQLALIDIYSSLENRPADAVAMGERLRQQHPANDDVDFAMADVYSSASMEDYAQAAAAYQKVIDRRRVDTSLDGSTARYRALLGLANARLNQWRLEDAIAALAPPIDAGVTNPDWVLPQFLLRRANYRGLLNDAGAVDDIKRVQNDARTPAAQQTAAINLMKWLDARKASDEGAIVAATLSGNRLTAEGKWDEARQSLEAVRAKYPQSPLVQYRLAYLDFARGESERALPALTAIAANKAASDSVRSNALLYAARAHDLAGRREEARKTYQKVVDDFEKQGAAGRAKVGLITPYKRPARST